MVTEYKPHCARCDVFDCDGSISLDAEKEYAKQAGARPKHSLMVSAWEHSLMVFCKAWKAAKEDDK